MTQDKPTIEKIIERVNAWQDAGFVHPLTCLYHSDENLFPVIENGKVVLKCPHKSKNRKCKYVQEHIPPSILTVDPQILKDEKQRLINIGFQF